MDTILDQFPKVEHAFAYGSGVFTQPGLYSSGSVGQQQPVLDFIFTVQDPIAWHHENINRHPSHYSCMSLLGSNMIDYVTRTIGSGVYFNALVPCGSMIIKYGVVDKETLKKDLLDWNALYLAGRLHKPVKYLASCDDILDAQKKNIQSAMKAAMLLCPQTFNISELLSIICSLSYIGDIRLGFAEDSKKVQRIVKGSHTHLRSLYHDPIHAALEDNMISLIGPSQSVVSSRSVFRNTQSLEDKAALYAALPNNVLHTITSQKRGDAIPRSVRKHVDNELAEYLASSRYGTLALQRALASIVRKSSFRQACLGALSAGPMRSIKYVSAKIAKFINK